MKLCIMGNSHLAAFRLGWDTSSIDFPQVQVDFFGAARSDLEHLALKRRTLTTKVAKVVRQLELTSGGKSRITLDDYQGFVLVGCGAGVCHLMRVATRHRTFAMSGQSVPAHLVSDAVFALAASHRIEASVFRRLLFLIRSVSSKPIVVVSTPLPRRGVESRFPVWSDAAVVVPHVATLWEAEKRKLVEEFDVCFIDQPETTIEGRFFTNDAYGVGSVRRLDAPPEDDDMMHMNALYGATFLRAIIPLFTDARSNTPTAPEPAVALRMFGLHRVLARIRMALGRFS